MFCKLIPVSSIIGPVRVDYLLPQDVDSTTELPSEPTDITYPVIGAVIAVVFVLIVLITFVVTVILMIRHRKAKFEFEKNRYKNYKTDLIPAFKSFSSVLQNAKSI